MVSADYIGFDSLLQICQAQLASLFKDKGIEELSQDFQVEEELTPELEEELIKRYQIHEA